MNKSASEVIRNLQMRVARLELDDVLSQLIRQKRVRYKKTAKVEMASKKFYSETFDEYFYVVKFSFSKGPYFPNREESFFVVQEDEDGDRHIAYGVEWGIDQYYLAEEYAMTGGQY